MTHCIFMKYKMHQKLWAAQFGKSEGSSLSDGNIALYSQQSSEKVLEEMKERRSRT